MTLFLYNTWAFNLRQKTLRMLCLTLGASNCSKKEVTMKILITSGGTTEKIDEVRSISNNSTGMLGKTIAEAFFSFESTEKIYYICGLSALTPNTDNTEVIRIGSVAELEEAVKSVLLSDRIDAVIHCMAVSDYSVKSVTTSRLIGTGLCNRLENIDLIEMAKDTASEFVAEAILKADTLSTKNKISSDVDDLILIMQKTPKIISMIKKLAPETLLVGFKLLNKVSYDTLIDVAYDVLLKNDCDYVIANDLSEISGQQHIGYLINKSKAVERLTSKKEIADKIATVVSKQINGVDIR